MWSEGCMALLYSERDPETGKTHRTHLQDHIVSELGPSRPLGSEPVVTVLTLIKCMPDAESFGCNTTLEPCLEEWAESGHVEMGTGLYY